MASLEPKLADIPETKGEEEDEEKFPLQQSVSEEEKEAKRKDDERFFERVFNLTQQSDNTKELDSSDYQFLTDFSICNITLTVYRELQNNSFFNVQEEEGGEGDAEGKERGADDEEARDKKQRLKRLQQFQTKGRFRLCQIYPVVLRSVIGYYSSVALNYYDDTIEQRRGNQVPLGLNDKAYAILCNSIRKLVEMQIEKDERTKQDILETFDVPEPTKDNV
jgi:hypothetical protein